MRKKRLTNLSSRKRRRWSADSRRSCLRSKRRLKKARKMEMRTSKAKTKTIQRLDTSGTSISRTLNPALFQV